MINHGRMRQRVADKIQDKQKTISSLPKWFNIYITRPPAAPPPAPRKLPPTTAPVALPTKTI